MSHMPADDSPPEPNTRPAIPVPVHVVRYDPRAAPESLQRAMYHAQASLGAERDPLDPIRPFDAWRDADLVVERTPLLEAHRFVALREERVVGYAVCHFPALRGHEHRLRLRLGVVPEARRNGAGRRLLAAVAASARRAGRTLVSVGTTGRQPGGPAWLERLGVRPGLSMLTNRLDLGGLDRALLRRWIEAAPIGDYRLLIWRGEIPEAHEAAFLDLLMVMHDAPKGELEDIREPITAEQSREWLRTLDERGMALWTVLACERAASEGDGAAFAGYTEMILDRVRPELVWQGDTAVRPEHRGRGIGKWLKAAMLEQLLEERPAARRVLTGNADANAPMLAINRRLGFAPHLTETEWEVPLDRIERYLAS